IYNLEIALTLMVDTRWTSSFECLDHVLQARSAIYAVLAEDSVEINNNVKATILDCEFWMDLKKLRDFLEPFIIFIRQLESDKSYLSLAYKTLQNLKQMIMNNSQITEELRNDTLQAARNRWVNFLYNPAIIVAYTLDPRYRGEGLDFATWRDIVNTEIIRIEGTDNKNEDNFTSNTINWWNLLRMQYPNLSQVARKILSILSTSAASERNWSAYGFINSKLRNRMLAQKAEKLVYIYWNTRIPRRLKRSVLIKNSQESNTANEETSSINPNNQENNNPEGGENEILEEIILLIFLMNFLIIYI
ncbi:2969_t:CDS:2, partial [Gigaspora margarita]